MHTHTHRVPTFSKGFAHLHVPVCIFVCTCTSVKNRDSVYENRPIQRFWLLETVARMPYFSYLSMLHFYETLGWYSIGTEVRGNEWRARMYILRMQ